MPPSIAAMLVACSTSAAALAGFPPDYGFMLVGLAESDTCGHSVSIVGDINHDGVDDMLVSAPRGAPGGRHRAGVSYVLFGGPDVETLPPLALALLDGSDGFVIPGIDPIDLSGESVAGGGDFNHDGVDDMIIAAYRADHGARVNSGEVYVVYGDPSIGASGVFDLVSLDGSNGFVIFGAAGDSIGYVVAFAGDVNNDTCDDIVIGAPSAGEGGEAYVVYGGAEVGSSGSFAVASLDGSSGFILDGDGGLFGRFAAAAGDFNDDGVDDLIFGAPVADPDDSRRAAGVSYIVYGGNNVGGSGRISATSLHGDAGFCLNGVSEDDLSGSAVACAGDINNDGVSDVVIGAPGTSVDEFENLGEAYVVYGRSGIAASTGVLELSSLNGTNGFTIRSVESGGRFGSAAAPVGDINGDSIDDVAITAPQADKAGLENVGVAHVVFGRPGLGASGVEILQGFGAADHLPVNGLNEFDELGFSVSGGGDVNGDSVPDIIIGARRANANGEASGRVIVKFGEAPSSDLNGDGCTNAVDLAIMLASWDAPGVADLNTDGVTDSADLAMLLAAWGSGC